MYICVQRSICYDICVQTLFLLGMEKTKHGEEKSGDAALKKKLKIQVCALGLSAFSYVCVHFPTFVCVHFSC